MQDSTQVLLANAVELEFLICDNSETEFFIINEVELESLLS